MIDIEDLKDGFIYIGFIKRIREQDIERKIIATEMTARYGDNLKNRIKKLQEEVNELAKAPEYTGEFLDELCDVNLVLLHINELVGTIHFDCAEEAMRKVRKRDFNPSYKRKTNK